MFYTLLLTALIVLAMVRNHKQDPGEHKKAKIFQMVCLILICLAYGSAIGRVWGFLGNFSASIETYSQPVGFVPGSVYLVINLLHLVLSFTLLCILGAMTKRTPWSRRVFLIIIPILATIELLNFYRGWISDGEELMFPALVIFLIGLIPIGGLLTGFILIYNSRFMKAFYNPAFQTASSDDATPTEPDEDFPDLTDSP